MVALMRRGEIWVARPDSPSAQLPQEANHGGIPENLVPVHHPGRHAHLPTQLRASHREARLLRRVSTSRPVFFRMQSCDGLTDQQKSTEGVHS